MSLTECFKFKADVVLFVKFMLLKQKEDFKLTMTI